MITIRQWFIHTPTTVALLAALWAIRCSGAYTEKYCSTYNTASTSANYSDFQSNGLCDTFCDGYSYAVLQDYSCWCSDYTPADSTNVDLDDCDTECPGYPDDNCGGDDLYVYLFRNKTPSGTKGASSSSSTATTSGTGTSAASGTSVSTATATATAIATATDNTGNHAQQTDTSSDDAAAQNSGGGLSTGAAVGIAIGVFIVLGVALVLFFLWWKKRRERQESSDDPSPRSSSAGMISGMTEPGQQGTKRGSKFMPIDERMEFHPDIYVRGGEGSPSRESMSSLRDDVDYSRRVLRATNPDPPAHE